MRISVCMAAYNGHRFIETQLRSILCQLGAEDELVLVDDGSRDNTVEIVAGLGDARIRVLRNAQNRGVIRTFERALTLAQGDLIFLSDQDDVWRSDKVAQFKTLFETHPEITLALSNAEVIDAEGNMIRESWFSNRPFKRGVWANLYKNRYLGCGMVFRRSVLDRCLPFPKDIPMHDMWIGIMGQLSGRVHFIEEPLIRYRRHGGNTAVTRAPLFQMIQWRIGLVKSIVQRLVECAGVWPAAGRRGVNL